MRSNDEAINRLYKTFQHMEGSFHILENNVPVEQQIAYFKDSGRLRKELKQQKTSNDDYERYMLDLQNDELSDDAKKGILLKLAVSKQVRAHRIIEKYLQDPSPKLTNWAYMALIESRISLESELSGEKQIYISTGLGGKGNKLRFFVLILSTEGVPFLDYQRLMIEKELNYSLPKAGCEIERLKIEEKFVELVCLTPIKVHIKKILEAVILECNQYGSFLSEAFIVTNVKEMNQKEIDQVMKKYWT